MTQLAPVRLDDGRVIYIETTDNIESPDVSSDAEPGLIPKDRVRDNLIQAFEDIKNTISSYTTYTLDAFNEIASANVNKVTLEFGIKLAGEAGIPYVTKGTAESNLKITVECTFPENQVSKT